MLRLDDRRLLGALDELAGIGAIEGGGCARLALSDEDKAGRDLVVGNCGPAPSGGATVEREWSRSPTGASKCRFLLLNRSAGTSPAR